MTSTTSSAELKALTAFREEAQWIWGAFDSQLDSYQCFRREFALEEEPTESVLVISADTDFVAWINGQEVARGQFSDWPHQKTFSCFSINSSQWPIGENQKNVLSVMAFHEGDDSFTHVEGLAGVRVALSMGSQTIISEFDNNWFTTAHRAFVSGRGERLTMQTGFTFEYDARFEEDWTTSAHELSSCWLPVQAAPRSDCTLEQRPLPALSVGDLGTVQIVAQGVYFAPLGEGPGVADGMAARALCPQPPWRIFSNPALKPTFPCLDVSAAPEDAADPYAEYAGSPRNPGSLLDGSDSLELRAQRKDAQGAGRYFIIDLGIETVGLLEFEIEAPSGTIIDIAHGEHLDDGRIRMKIGNRSFADRYICGVGRRQFQMPFRRLAARYLEVHISGVGPAKIYSFGLRTVSYPMDASTAGSFESDDRLLGWGWETGVRTLDLCRHEHFEDCPWREQALYAYDSRLQALYGYHAFGDYKFPEVSFRLIAQGFDWESGLLPLTAPGRSPINIPFFTLTWIGAIAEHWRYSGRDTLYAEFRKVVRRILDVAMAEPRSGIYLHPEGEKIWNFYEWTRGLCGSMGSAASAGDRPAHAAYNLYLHEALRSAEWMARQAGEFAQADFYKGRARQLSLAGHEIFYDSGISRWRTLAAFGGSPFVEMETHELIQALAAVEWGGAFSASDQKAHPPVPCALSSLQTVTQAALSGHPESRQWICERLENTWEKMRAAGATTFWETAAGASDFDFAGSLCHGWNSLPVWYAHAVMLGVQPLEPGFRKFSVKVYPHRLAAAQGRIPTPEGMIEISWRKARVGIHLEINSPPFCVPELSYFPEVPIISVLWNGAPVTHELPELRNRESETILAQMITFQESDNSAAHPST